MSNRADQATGIDWPINEGMSCLAPGLGDYISRENSSCTLGGLSQYVVNVTTGKFFVASLLTALLQTFHETDMLK